MKLAVIGSRSFDDYRILKTTLEPLIEQFKVTTIVSGGAKGADSLAEKFAKEHGLELNIFPADWDKHGKAAGYIRNVDIWNNSDLGVAFWDGESKGTAHSFQISKKQNKQLFVFDYSKMDFYLI
jgi:hypothetical protein